MSKWTGWACCLAGGAWIGGALGDGHSEFTYIATGFALLMVGFEQLLHREHAR